MKKFRTKSYEFSSPGIKAGSRLRFALLADLHGLSFGKENALLLEKIRQSRPDAVLAAGDMIVRILPESLKTAENLLVSLAGEFPVIFAPGNHEARMSRDEVLSSAYREYADRLVRGGVHVLCNERTDMELGGMRVVFHGLDLPMIYYHKPNSPKLKLTDMEALLGRPEKGAVNVLLAHNPKYGRAYFSWGADLTVSGHYHGGIVRLTEHIGLSCPQYLLFPPFCCGDFHRGDRHMVVSAGIGEHTIPLRIHNPRELLLIDLKGRAADGHFSKA